MTFGSLQLCPKVIYNILFVSKFIQSSFTGISVVGRNNPVRQTIPCMNHPTRKTKFRKSYLTRDFWIRRRISSCHIHTGYSVKETYLETVQFRLLFGTQRSQIIRVSEVVRLHPVRSVTSWLCVHVYSILLHVYKPQKCNNISVFIILQLHFPTVFTKKVFTSRWHGNQHRHYSTAIYASLVIGVDLWDALPRMHFSPRPSSNNSLVFRLFVNMVFQLLEKICR